MLIPNDDWQSAILEEDELTDGNPYSTPDKTGVRHIDYFLHIFKQLGIELPNQRNELSFALELARHGFVVAMNSAKPVDAKYFAIIVLPKQMSKKQCVFFEKMYPIFEKYYHDDLTFVFIYTNDKLPYRSTYRDLQIEKQIMGQTSKSNLSMLYEEIAKQKREFKTK